ncbi:MULTISPECIES: sigma 54-interacting transcriptional regulator [Clostridium]|uniref:Sigma 54-interacting transcriptional regulator n=1 Tax=Clostridium lapidicellarium TaxID=3240931 RepID=A0ABV4DUM6_9CLOT
MGIFELIYKVKDIMTRGFIKVYDDETLENAFDKMVKYQRDEILIVDNSEKLIGIFTIKDVIRSRYRGISLKDSIIKYASKNVLTIDSNSSARFARDMMIKKNIGRLPVTEKDHIIGVITNNNFRDTFYIRVDELFKLQNYVFDNLHEGVCMCDGRGIVKYWNKSCERVYDVKVKEILGKYIGDFFPNAMILKVLNTKHRIDNAFHEPVKGKFVVLSVLPIYDSNKKLVAVVSTDRDMTDEVNLTKQLEDEKKRVEFFEYAYKNEISSKYNFSFIVGKNKKIIDAISIAQKVAPTSTSVLITGKSGTGKEVFAKAIHKASKRTGSFVAINCSAIPVNLFESELFGYVEGAFTGAIKRGKIGKFELANKGTLFLDEIGDMPMEMQAKLLRVLQDGVVYRLGSEKSITTSARIISATNKDLKELISKGEFREDLFYRLAVVQINLPDLKDRREDIKDLSKLFLRQVSEAEGIEINYIDEKVYRILSDYKWNGNIRELKNVIQRMVVLSDNGKITVESIPEYIKEYINDINIKEYEYDSKNRYDLQKITDNVEKRTIEKVMKMAHGNKNRAAKILNIKRSTLYYKLSKLKL